MAETFVTIMICLPILIIATVFYHLSMTRNPYAVILWITGFLGSLYFGFLATYGFDPFIIAILIFVGAFFIPYKKDYKPKKSSFDDEFVKDKYTDEKS